MWPTHRSGRASVSKTVRPVADSSIPFTPGPPGRQTVLPKDLILSSSVIVEARRFPMEDGTVVPFLLLRFNQVEDEGVTTGPVVALVGDHDTLPDLIRDAWAAARDG